MKKTLFLLFVIACISLISCENDDYKLPEQPQQAKYELNVGESLILTPHVSSSSAIYRWFVDGKLTSNSKDFHFKALKSGNSNVTLETTLNGSTTKTVYTVSVSYQLQSSLNSYSLTSSNGTSTTGGYYWNQTYSNTKFTSGIFTFSHTGGVESG